MNGAYVVDASVIAKWYLTDEEAADKAASLYDRYYQGLIALSAPSLITYEVARAVHRGYRQRRISIDDATSSLADLADLNLRLFHEPEIIAAAYRIAEEYRCNFYDACYLALADLLGPERPAHPEESAARTSRRAPTPSSNASSPAASTTRSLSPSSPSQTDRTADLQNGSCPPPEGPARLQREIVLTNSLPAIGGSPNPPSRSRVPQ